MKKLLILVLLVAVAVGYGFYFYNDNLTAVDEGKTKMITIEGGSSSDYIGAILLENNLIKNLTVYKIYLRQNNLGSQLKAGDFEINDSLRLPEIIDLIIEAENVVKTTNFPAPEGFNIKEVSKIISSEFEITQEQAVKMAAAVRTY